MKRIPTITRVLLLLVTSFALRAQPCTDWAKNFGGASGDAAYTIVSNGIDGVFTTAQTSKTTNYTGTAYLPWQTEGSLLIRSNLDGTLISLNEVVYSSNMVIDAVGNFYFLGFIGGDFDPGPGVYNLTGSYNNVFLWKLDKDAKLIWAKKLPGTTDNRTAALVLDQYGHIYAAGNFSGTLDFDPTPNDYSLTSNGKNDIFITKFDTAGTLIWAKSIGGSEEDHVSSITVDSMENVYTTGSFTGLVDFDPGASTFNMTSNGKTDIFVSKLNEYGGFVWGISIGGSMDDSGGAIQADGFGNVYVTGLYRDAADFNPGPNTGFLFTFNETEKFLLKLSSGNTHKWARNLGLGGGEALDVDQKGNVYVGGYGFSALTMVDSLGAVLWEEECEHPKSVHARSVDVDIAGNVFFAGYYTNDQKLTTGNCETNFYSEGFSTSDAFLAKLEQPVTGIEEVTRSKTDLVVFPNPVGEVLQYSLSHFLPSDIHRVTIRNALGVLAQAQQSKTAAIGRLNVSGLPPGVYFIEVKMKTGSARTQFIKI